MGPGRSFIFRTRVRYADVDRMGVVHHPVYLQYLENARIELLRELGFPHRELEDRGIRFVVSEIHIRYVAPAGYDDEIEVRTEVARVRRASVVFRYRVCSGGRRLCIARLQLVATNGTGRIVKVPEALYKALKECEGNVENPSVH